MEFIILALKHDQLRLVKNEINVFTLLIEKGGSSMKKLWLSLIVFLFALGACNHTNPSKPASTSATTITAVAPSAITSLAWTTYTPEDIKQLGPGEYYWDDWGTDSKYRTIYYNTGIASWILTYDDPKFLEILDIIEKRHHSTDRFAESDEMNLVAVIKHCGITKNDLVEAIEKDKQLLLRQNAEREWANEFDHEMWELPNPDIIYTFDNEIINAYYRRENPVAPEPGTYKTYESYEEYKKAN